MHMRSSYRPVKRQNGVSKQKNTNNYFSTALPNKRTRTITFQRRYQTKEREQLLLNGVFSSFIGSNPILPVRYGRIAVQPVQFEQPVELIARQAKKDCRPAPIAVALF